MIYLLSYTVIVLDRSIYWFNAVEWLLGPSLQCYRDLFCVPLRFALDEEGVGDHHFKDNGLFTLALYRSHFSSTLPQHAVGLEAG